MSKTSPPTARPTAERRSGRLHDPQRTMANILEVATREFGEKGLTYRGDDSFEVFNDDYHRLMP